MFTKQHFEEVAIKLRDARLYAASSNADAATIIDILTSDFSDIFSDDNPLFDRSRFYDATAIRN